MSVERIIAQFLALFILSARLNGNFGELKTLRLYYRRVANDVAGCQASR